MEWKQNFGMVIWIIPFYACLFFGAFFPAYFIYIFAFGLTLTVVGLFVQIFVYQYIARGYNLLKVKVDYKPQVIDGSSVRYWQWPNWFQFWWKELPKQEHYYGKYNYCWLKLEKPYVHPKYNSKSTKLWWVKFIFEGDWNDIILGRPGQGYYSTAIVDIPHVDDIWVTELTGRLLPMNNGHGRKEMLNHIPPLMQYNGYAAYHAVFHIKRATGTIDPELKEKEEIYQLAGFAER